MFNYCIPKPEYEPKTYEKFIRDNVVFVNEMDNILQKTKTKIKINKRNNQNAKVSNVIKSKLNSIILLLDKLNTNNNIIASIINKYRYQSKLQCDRKKKYVENKKKNKNTFIKKVIISSNRIDKPKCKRGLPSKNILKNISKNIEQTKKYSFENEDKNDTKNENILDFLYCYNYNQKLAFD